MWSTIFLAFLTSYTFFLPLANATAVQDDDVSWAVVVLSDIPATLATPFCEGFVASYAPTAGVGNIGGGATVTVTTTVGVKSCGTVVPSVVCVNFLQLIGLNVTNNDPTRHPHPHPHPHPHLPPLLL